MGIVFPERRLVTGKGTINADVYQMFDGEVRQYSKNDSLVSDKRYHIYIIEMTIHKLMYNQQVAK